MRRRGETGTAVKNLEIARLIQNAVRAGPAPDADPERDERVNHRAAHHRRLDDIGPDHRANASRRRVERGQRGHQHDRPAVNPDRLFVRRRRAMEHLVPDHDDDRRDVEPRAAGQQARDQEDGAGGVAGRDPKPDLEKFVDRNDVIVVKGPDEKIGHDDPRDYGADGQLRVEEVPPVIALGRRAEKGRRAQLRRDDRGQHRPPGHLPAAHAELAHVVAAMPRRGQPHADDEGKIGQNGECVPEITHRQG